MKKLYFAGPLGFSELGTLVAKKMESLLEVKYQVINPFKTNPELSEKIISINHSLQDSSFIGNFNETKKELHTINIKIGQNNVENINKSDVIFALLDGSDVDSGTAAEIGYAFGIGKIIYGYRGDFRLSADNYGSKVNLQVEYFIEKSGGKIFTSLAEFEQEFLGN